MGQVQNSNDQPGYIAGQPYSSKNLISRQRTENSRSKSREQRYEQVRS